MLTYDEILLLLILSIGAIGIPVVSYFKKDYTAIWSPINMVCIIYIYYAIVGPLNSIIKDETNFRLVNHREYYSLALFSCIIAFYSTLLGFSSTKKGNFKIIPFNPSLKKLEKNGLYLFIIAFVAFTIFAGGDIKNRLDFLDTSKEADDFQGSLAAYLMLSINLMIVAVCLVFFNLMKSKKYLLFVILFVIAASLFINEAFRYRLVILVVAVYTSYHLYKKVKPNLILMVAIVVPFLLLMGVMEVARQYGHGLNVERAEGLEYNELADKSLNETAVFWTTGFFMDQAIDRYGYTYFDFITNTIAAPIPRKLWPSKPNGSYMFQTSNLYGENGVGQAFLNFAEYYLAFGWFGVVVFSFIIGFLLKKAWLWFLINKDNPMAITAIATFNGFIYVIISRNYTTQHVTLFFFTVYPAFFIIWLYKKDI